MTKETSEPVLHESDVRFVIRLLGEVIEMHGSPAVKKRHLMSGLCTAIDADAWAWSLVHMEAELAPRQVVMLHGGFDEARLAKWIAAIEHPDMKPVTEALVEEAIREQRGFTRKDYDFVPHSWWESNSTSMELWKDANLGSLMLSAWPLPTGGFSGIGFYRNHGRPHFNSRECRLAHIVLSEIPWLHTEGNGPENGSALTLMSPRQRTVLHLLIQGWARKSIAEHLGISLNTVHGYVKEIYAHFKVSSQATLMTRFTCGDDGDRAR